MINIILAEDMHIVRAGIRALLKDEVGVRVIAQAEDGEEVLTLVEKHKHEVNLVVMDLEMPKKGGLEASIEIKEKYQGVGIVILTTHKGKAFLRRALTIGIPGYILKADYYDELMLAIRTVASGEEYYGAELVKLQREIIREANEPPKPKLSKRQIQIVELLKQGLTTEEVANKLFISANTVHTHRRNMLQKLNLGNTVELVVWAIKEGLISPELESESEKHQTF
ncbi:MAG: response regulator transcription factor [Bacteroidota bacterium]